MKRNIFLLSFVVALLFLSACAKIIGDNACIDKGHIKVTLNRLGNRPEDIDLYKTYCLRIEYKSVPCVRMYEYQKAEWPIYTDKYLLIVDKYGCSIFPLVVNRVKNSSNAKILKLERNICTLMKHGFKLCYIFREGRTDIVMISSVLKEKFNI